MSAAAPRSPGLSSLPPAPWDVTPWDVAKWQSGLDLLARLAKLLQLDFDRVLDGAPTMATALRQLDPVLPALAQRLQQLAEQERARHTGRRPTELERLGRALAAAGVDPATPLTKTLWGRFNTNRTTMKRALAALASGKFGGVPP